MPKYVAILSLLKTVTDADDLTDLFKGVPAQAYAFNEDGTITIALNNGYALTFAMSDGRPTCGVYTIDHVQDGDLESLGDT